MNPITVAEKHFRVGQAYFSSGNYVSAISELDAAIMAYEQARHLPRKLRASIRSAFSYVRLGRVDIATKYFNDSLAGVRE